MDHIVSGEEEEELGVDIEEGVRFNETQDTITTNQEDVWSGRLSYDHRSENITDDEDDPLMGGEGKRRERSSQSLDLSDRKFDNVKVKKTRKPSSKPPRPPKGPLLTANDQKLMREIAELAMRKRARIERMRRMKAAKSSSPCSSVLAMIVTVIFFVFLIFQGFFTSNASLSSSNSPAPDNNRMVSVQFYNEFAPRERIDPSPTTTFRYKRVSGADNEENTREVTR
ncbi:unnamed protein product [Eruca vesicaria subsp. sativa]|uniref:Transmembrane protein n=1 Tax=Eruca vesicaria subsp. sativa TaxID=29727 RepID=A0ABC8J4E8_ERUVS|nr:unnamed protein product [Eruca vesicaria subsp. sativa]